MDMDQERPAVQFAIDESILTPLVQRITEGVLRHQEQEHRLLADRLAWSEGEAAALLGLKRHQLRDERLRGNIQASVGPARKILYTYADLRDYLARRRWSKDSN
jgi:hypothetical protein